MMQFLSNIYVDFGIWLIMWLIVIWFDQYSNKKMQESIKSWKAIAYFLIDLALTLIEACFFLMAMMRIESINQPIIEIILMLVLLGSCVIQFMLANRTRKQNNKS